MSANFQPHFLSGSTLYAVLTRLTDGDAWTGSAWEALNAAHWTTYAIALTEQSTTGYYYGSMPAAQAAGLYEANYFLQAGGSPATTDALVASQVLDWTGTADIGVGNTPPVNVTQLLGTAWLTPGTAGTPDVNAVQIGGSIPVHTGGRLWVLDGSGNAVGTAANQATIIAAVAALGSPMQAGNVTVGGYATHEDPAYLVLNAVQASYNTPGTIGYDIGAAGAATDPLTNPVPGSYASGTAGAALGRIGSAQIVTSSIVAQNGNFGPIVQGADYLATDGRAIDFTDASDSWPDLTGGSCLFRSYFGGTYYTHVMSLVTVGTSSQVVRLEFTAAQTAALPPGGQRQFDVLATLASGNEVVLLSGQWSVSVL